MITTNEKTQLIHKLKEYAVYADRVKQSDFTAQVINRHRIVSDYHSPELTRFSSLVRFKLSLNGHDNEAPGGHDHLVNVKQTDGHFIAPIVTFGEKDPDTYAEGEHTNLPANTRVTFRVDMNPVFKAFRENGYYSFYDGSRMAAEDFQGLYIAGGTFSMKWEFENLPKEPAFQLKETDQEGIFATTLVLNPQNEEEPSIREWALQHDVSSYPYFKSDWVLLDALYNLSLDETEMLIEDDGTFRTGAEWEGVWTRDISYSVILSYAFLAPEISKTSLMKKVEAGRIVQDIGSGGAWPVSTDRIVWTLAAWEIYLVTGDHEWLSQTFQISHRTLQTDFNTIVDEQTGLVKGESSFLDWREQTYPDWMDNVDISQSLTLGTNVAFAHACHLMSVMAGLLQKNEEEEFYQEKSQQLKSSINQYLWNEEKGFYNQYLYGRHFMNQAPRWEALGESLAILYQVADYAKAEKISANAPIVAFGAPSIYPQILNVPPYHNDSVWPFVQAFWIWAAARAGNPRAVTTGISALMRPAAFFLTNKENLVAGTGDYLGTEVNSDRQLWSVAGMLAMPYRVFLGLEYQLDGLHFSPLVPEPFRGDKTIENFRYRDSILSIHLRGFGDKIAAITLDGEAMNLPMIPAGLSGSHEIIIQLSNGFSDTKEAPIVENHFTLPAPDVQLKGDELHWPANDKATQYIIFQNGEKIAATRENHYDLREAKGQFKVAAMDEAGWLGYTSEPVDHYLTKDRQKVKLAEKAREIEKNGSESGDSGGIITIDKDLNSIVRVPVTIAEPGKYLLSFLYANGSGPRNTGNRCAIRTLFVNAEKAGTVIMPQRGEGEWNNWGLTNQILTILQEGENQVELRLEPDNENMDGNVNMALLDYLEVIRIE